MKKVILFAIVALVVQACSQKIEMATLANTKWTLSEWPGRTMPVSAQATLNFDADNKIGGKSFCNTYGGSSRILNGTVKFDQIFSTKMFCSESGDAENKYQADLQTVNGIKMDGGKLVLLKDGQVVMAFVKTM